MLQHLEVLGVSQVEFNIKHGTKSETSSSRQPAALVLTAKLTTTKIK